MQIKLLKNLDIKKGTRVLVRTSLNSPIIDGEFADTFRIKKSLETMKYLSDKGAKVTLIAHIGRDGKSFTRTHKKLSEFIKHKFVEDIVGDKAISERKNLKEGEILLLENIRRDEREEKNSKEFAKELIFDADLYVFDSFDVAHRENASVVQIPQLIDTYVGFQFEKEIEVMEKISTPENPSVAILGGAKTETKIPLIGKMLEKYDKVFIGGVLINTALSAKGLNIGNSMVGDKESIKKYLEAENLILPVDLIVENENGSEIVSLEEVKDQDVIVDVGPKSLENLTPILSSAKNIVWNGPLGWYKKGYTKSSLDLSDLITKTDAFCVVGGGDSIALLNRENKLKDWDFVSTGGGAMIHYLSEGTLPFLDSL